MKRLAVLFFALPGIGSALYLGNPAEPQLIEEGLFTEPDHMAAGKIGYQGDWVSDRKLRGQGDGRGRIDQFEVWMNQGVATLNFIDRIELSASLGSMTTTFSQRRHADGILRQFQTHDGLTVGTGLSLLLMQWKNTILGIDGKYQYSTPHLKWVSVNGTGHASGGKVVDREWQVGMALSYTADLFTPYIGASYSSVHARVSGLSGAVYPDSHFEMRSRHRFGLAVGCSLSQTKKIDLTLEARMIDEQAVTGAINIKF
jgi:hypothetical protein